MKKTLILMFAAACSAMAADYTEVTETGTALDMQNFGKDYLHGANSLATTANFTLVFSVDFSNISSNDFVSLSGNKANTTSPYSIGVEVNSTGTELCFTSGTNRTVTVPANADYYSMTLSCYEYYNGRATVTVLVPTLYAWKFNEKGTLEATPYTSNKTWDISYLKDNVTLNFNTDLIDSVRVYNSVLTGTDAENAAKAVLGFTPGDGNVPEPTTATLSLLALAGLAARRRRK